MRKLSVCVLFGGVSPEHEVSLRSAESVLSNLDTEKYDLLPVGITREGEWVLYGDTDWSALPSGRWETCPENRQAAMSPIRGQGLLSFEGDCVVREHVDVIFPALHGENGEDGALQGLAQLAAIPCVGSGVAASAAAMDKFTTKLVADKLGVPQADWLPVVVRELNKDPDAVIEAVERRFDYPVFVKPAGTGSSVGVSKAKDRMALLQALDEAGKFDSKILVERFIDGQEIEVGVLGNDTPDASVVGEIDSGTEFYDYDAKYITDSATLYIPARISEDSAETVRDMAVKIYAGLGCRGLSRVDFFVQKDGTVIFNEINTLPGFTSISMYPKLFAASGIAYPQLLDRLIELALEG